MPISLAVQVNYSFNPDNEEWEAVMTPTLTQRYPGYYHCTDCTRVLHESEVVKDRPHGKCPSCNHIALPMTPDKKEMEETEYCAGSICEVNSAAETVVLQLQRSVEQAAQDLRGAEERAQAKREGKEAPDDDESAAQG